MKGVNNLNVYLAKDLTHGTHNGATRPGAIRGTCARGSPACLMVTMVTLLSTHGS